MLAARRISLAAGLALATAGLAAAAPAATPERSSCSMYFVASVRHGPRAGSDYRGVLRMKLDKRDRFAGGTFRPLEGGQVTVKSTARGRAVSFSVPGRAGTLKGTGRVTGLLRPCAGTMKGTLSGPGPRDRGDWLAASGQTIALPGGATLISAPATHVIYKADNALSPARVFAGALNTPGSADGQRLAARMNMPGGIGYDAAQSLVYIADVANASIRRLNMNTNQVTTMVRPSDVVSAARAAGFTVAGWEPQGVAVAGGGAVFISDARNYVIWKYNPSTLQLKLLAGRPGSPGNADGSDSAVRFTGPQQLLSPDGAALFVADVVGNRVRIRNSGTWSTVSACC
jgi:DNA-binding beta-propeller fold protein YncE